MTDRWHHEMTPLGCCVFRHAAPEMWFFPDQWGRPVGLATDTGPFGEIALPGETICQISAVVVALTGRTRFGSAKSATREALCWGLVKALNTWEATAPINYMPTDIGDDLDQGVRGNALSGTPSRAGGEIARHTHSHGGL